MINKLSEILYNGEHPVLLKFIPYLKQVILYSDIVNKNIIDSSITKKMMPFSAVGTGAEALSRQINCENIVKISPTSVAIGRVALSRLDNPKPANPLYMREADVSI